jgi:hypothetical protein
MAANFTATGSDTYPAGIASGSAFMAGTGGGTSHQGSTTGFQQRILSTVFWEDSCLVTLSSNAFTFDAVGTYVILGTGGVYNSNRHIIKLQYDSTVVSYGTCEYTGSGVMTRSFVTGRAVIASGEQTGGGSVKTFSLYTGVQTAVGGNGHGVDSTHTTDEQYTTCTITKIG